MGSGTFKLDFDLFKEFVDNLYDEVIVWDNNYRVAYVNKASFRHYGMFPEEMIGKTFQELTAKEYWYPSVLPRVYKEKQVMSIKQRTYLGAKIMTTAVPIFDSDGEIKYVVMSVRDMMEEKEMAVPEIEEGIEDNIKIVAVSQKMDKLLSTSEKVAKVDSSALILGESGTGKSILAKYIHKKSMRKKGPFVALNCASINKNLMESELFGYVRGAFTGASSKGKKGLVEVADGGTLFLDEIGEMPIDLQAKFLHVLQDQEFIPVGSHEAKKVDIRIIAATNRDIDEMIKNEKFRQDLYYRINIFELYIPPLRDRKEDIIPIANYYLNYYNEKYGKMCYFDEECLEVFKKYSWPGNIRELAHIVERMIVTSDKRMLKASLLPGEFFKLNTSLEKYQKELDIDAVRSLDYELEKYEGKLIKKFYEKYPSSRKLGKRLEISQSKAARLIKKYTLGDIES